MLSLAVLYHSKDPWYHVQCPQGLASLENVLRLASLSDNHVSVSVLLLRFWLCLRAEVNTASAVVSDTLLHLSQIAKSVLSSWKEQHNPGCFRYVTSANQRFPYLLSPNTEFLICVSPHLSLSPYFQAGHNENRSAVCLGNIRWPSDGHLIRAEFLGFDTL